MRPEVGAVLAASLLLRCTVSQYPYSGFQNKGGTVRKDGTRMFGDYEAQRHWMEITLHTPMSVSHSFSFQHWVSHSFITSPPSIPPFLPPSLLPSPSLLHSIRFLFSPSLNPSPSSLLSCLHSSLSLSLSPRLFVSCRSGTHRRTITISSTGVSTIHR